MTTDRRRPTVEVIEESAFPQLVDEWDDLLVHSETPTVFLSWAWVSSWRETVGVDQRLLIATARRPEDGLLVGIAPMTIKQRAHGRLLRYRALQFAGGGSVASDHLDLMIRSGYEEAAEPLWAAIGEAGRWDVIALNGLRSGSHLADLITKTAGFRKRYVERRPCPVVTLPGSWDEYNVSLGRNLRRNLRRYARKLDDETAEPVTVRAIDQPDEADKTIRKLASLHLKTHAAKGSRSSFATDDIVGFHRLLAARLLEAGTLRLYRLDVGASTIAIEYCFSHSGVVSSFQTAYDPAWARYGPGRCLVAYAIRRAIEEGADRFDFLRGDESYKRDWGATAAFDDRIWMPVSPLGAAVVRLRTTARMATGRLVEVPR